MNFVTLYSPNQQRYNDVEFRREERKMKAEMKGGESYQMYKTMAVFPDMILQMSSLSMKCCIPSKVPVIIIA
jgi:hypothetical protein